NEPPVPGDPTTAGEMWPAMNGGSGVGEVTAPVVYVNYGLSEDYDILADSGVDVRGKIVIARYGRSFRGIKAREAESHGAAGLLMYSDPQDDGFFRGDVYPEGPMRNSDGVQRGSIFNGNGDPSTPGWASTEDARRLPSDSMGLSHIPVIPIGYGNASLILEKMKGPDIPQDWQGGLPFRYHMGGERVRVRMGVWAERGERGYKSIINTFGRIEGSEWPDEVVIAGGHRDAWGPGAVDNVSGIVSLLEAARAMGTALEEGFRPRRTVVFATWDAEEWGLVGATEWVESREEELVERVVAYLNQDVAASGRNFSSSATPSLYPFIREVAGAVTQPGDTVSIHQAWRKDEEVADTAMVMPGVLGGGSDFEGFYNHLGIPALDFGFGGPGGTYHSAYDTWTWMETFGDPGYLSHTAAGKVTAVMMARLANADVVPFDYESFALHLDTLAGEVRTRSDSLGWTLPLDSLDAAIQTLMAEGVRFNHLRQLGLEGGTPSPSELAEINEIVQQVEQAMTREEGLVGRPWRRNLIYASDRNNGYANIPLPSINEAIEDGDEDRAVREVLDLAARINDAATTVREAAEIME
ncbi:MAG: M20/M25/M40 family metallo-hydrolase, partial [Gemmatimonadales bacterium]